MFSNVNLESHEAKKRPLSPVVPCNVAVLEPGDVLYVPHKWWHWVKCVDDGDEACISVNQWLPLKDESRNSLGEALVSLLSSSLFPNYQPLDENWINDHKNPMLSPKKSIDAVRMLAKKGMARELEPELKITCFPEGHEVVQPTSDYFGKSEGPPESGWQTESDGKLLTEREIVDSILSPTVINEIVRNLMGRS